MLGKKPKDKIKELVDLQDRANTKHTEALNRMIRNNKTISDHAKHRPAQTG